MGELLNKIKKHKWYKSNLNVKDSRARKLLEKNSRDQKSIMPGQLIMFDYFEPLTKDELEYYDAMPVTIFFGVYKTSKGKRVIGFNVHYYPPRVRYALVDKIHELFKSYYKDGVLKKSAPVQYSELMQMLKSAKLDFGVRMYDPRLMRHVTPIPLKEWPEAMFTEGAFKKSTREAILKYWRTFKS